jgi:hypothetical protein
VDGTIHCKNIGVKVVSVFAADDAIKLGLDFAFAFIDGPLQPSVVAVEQ